MWKFQPPGPQKVTLFGNGVFADVISYHELTPEQGGYSCSVTGVLMESQPCEDRHVENVV